MSAMLGTAGKKLFKKHREQYAPPDPFHETYTTNEERKNKERCVKNFTIRTTSKDDPFNSTHHP
ncbi:uncharacterized protein LACBIDRAFT_306336 [Laccaria bicolor S238N-H82]|uniref:Predicted protein n=1 Tax=Laccaria bicolor (strain S238N-H82 / ATCC MYA-4686) TaxID=486041 RepID=B0DN55_LACBS|nr:uncharacterized protein LACBIDRAFT_306336 [Laccaria bicolor S238N-H82]EDR04085.1 predicted protein [Laccaria bicolor S238N-H82]|eukprot:XP_001885340.1 predicted protein [Laccaria bicolor S238N-H82]